ncbi:HIV Tat-specific factor 1-like [Uloborus diversus]|uniref:HIV Tat-specific factor 1-like n=1 Tax=Uloborus diversus TaxID=327109 RepID=UPI002408FEE7|nr:HIV Tat-specific factor 1-like [Uloborus diversus]
MADEDFAKQLELEELEKRRKEQADGGVADPYTYTDPNDGTVYEWDADKQAWFPKVDDDFIAKYQANYTYQNPEGETQEEPSPQQVAASRGEKRKANDPTWFQVDDDHNTNVYVSGLPENTTEEEFVELMGKCGLVMKDPDTMKYKIKLYRDSNGVLKGDARCCYIKIESVKLALDILDGYLFKGNHQIHVERAQFELKGDYDPSKKPRKKKQKDKEKMKKKIEKLFDWRPDKLRGMRSRHENTVIIKNMFDPKEFEEDATLLLDYQKDVREECSKCGEVKKVVIYDRNPEGVVAVTFSEPEMADECINLMNGRWFAARQLSARTWDGKTKYKVVESEVEKQKRLSTWEKYLEQKDSSASKPVEPPSNQEKTVLSHTMDVPSKTYELAGETDSSGDSDGESEKTSVAPKSYPVMQSNGKFMSFDAPTSGGC